MAVALVSGTRIAQPIVMLKPTPDPSLMRTVRRWGKKFGQGRFANRLCRRLPQPEDAGIL